MKYKCLIVDDEELARELIKTHLSSLAEFELVASCTSAIEAYNVIQKESIDLIFLDIEMPQLKGTDFLKNLKINPKVIFTTAYREYALEGYELDVIDYLLKPITFSRFLKAVDKFKKNVYKKEERVDSSIYIQRNKKSIKVRLDEIWYIESVKDYVKIYLKEEEIQFKSSISAFEKRLNSNFLRVHRSYIVNTTKITAFTKKDIEIEWVEIPIGDYYKKNVFAKLGRI